MFQPLFTPPMKVRLFILYVVLVSAGNIAIARQVSSRPTKFAMDDGWLFHKGEIPFPVIKGHGESYQAAKAGIAPGAAAINFDDSNWRRLSVPHDWAMENLVDSTENIAQGYRKRGIGWYRKHFRLEPGDKGKHLELQFEGIATHATIWINGQVVYRSWSAYNASYIDMTAIARYGDDLNTIAVRVDAEAMEGWWYEGAGIYRHTWLIKRSPLHIVTDGVFAQPVKLKDGTWHIPAQVTVYNSLKQDETIQLEMTLLDRQNKTIATALTKLTAQMLEKKTAMLSLKIHQPRLWSIEDPVLYQVKTVLKQNGHILDEVTTTCGFRTIRFDARSGFFLNDKHVKIKGVCNHIDHAGVGTAVPDALWDFRFEKIKEMGANAFRSSHNAPSKRVLDICDSLGILVMDENRNFNSSPEYLSQLEWMVRRDRNHPSVILWSVFNEEPVQGTPTGYEMVRRMVKQVKQLDTTRPVTAAMNGGFFEPVNVSQAVDVMGFNYEIKHYDRFHAENPNIPVTSSEDASAVMIRGEYTTDRSKNLLDSYDTQSPPWGATHRQSWKLINERPWMAGSFMWTGFDYHGEPTPYTWPSVNSSFGILDLCGFPKAAFYIKQAQWIDDRPILHLIPHWNWPKDSIGKPIKVMVISNADKVRLTLNGKLIGEKPSNTYTMAEWMVPYAPGKLEAIGYQKGKEVSHFAVETTGAPVRLNLKTYKPVLLNDGQDATPVTVEAFDSQGRHVPTANVPVNFTINTSGTIIGLGNGNPNSHEAEKGAKQSLFNGLAQVILQSVKNADGPVILTAESEGLKSASLKIDLKSAGSLPFIPMAEPMQAVDKWSLSPASPTKPDPNIILSDNDMNSWQSYTAGTLQKMVNGNFTILRASFIPFDRQKSEGGQLAFKQVWGKAEFWLDGNLLVRKSSDEPQNITVDFPPGSQKHVISILFNVQPGKVFGLGGIVSIHKKQ